MRILKYCLATALSAVAIFAQDQARLIGTVLDPSGAVVPAATVALKNQKSGETRTVATDEKGNFFAPNLAPTSYTVTASMATLISGEQVLTLAAGQERNLKIIVSPSAVSETVTVVGDGLTEVDTSSARIGANVNEREVANLPLNGRQLSQLYLVVPGAQTAGGGSFDNIRFSGRANQQNAVRFDGIEGSSIVDSSPGNLNGESSSPFRLQSSLENIQEFRVESSNYPAEYGTGSGGQITVVTKSGGNEFHGSLFEYVRNNAFDARNFFDADKSKLRLNQFGGSFGGRIIPNKTFFFASIEGLRQRANVNLIATVPSASARLRAVDFIKPLLAAFPNGQTPTSNPDLDFVSKNASYPVNENYGSFRLDHHFNDRFNLTARYFRDEGEAHQPLDVSGSEFVIKAVPQNGMVSLQQILSPTVIHETKLGFNGAKTRASGYAPAVPGVDMSLISVDISGSTSIAGIAGQAGSAGTARPGGLVRSNSTQNGRGQPYTNYTLSFIDSLSVIKTNHNLKFGMEIRPIRIYTDRLGGTTYTFSNVNDFLANRPAQIQFLGDVSAPSVWNGGATGDRYAKQVYYVGYVQDEWKIRQNLTMSYGLRYEYYSVIREDRNLAVVVDADSGQLLPSNTPYYRTSKTNFGPRLGFSWSPAKMSGKTVLRIGAGYYYGPGQTEDQIQPIESDRVSRTLTNTIYPIVPAELIASYNINDPNLGFQPRAYSTYGYRLPERILSFTASLQQQLPGNAVLTVAYVGSQGRNLFLRSWTNRIVGFAMNPTTGAASEIRQFGNRFAQMDYKTSGGNDNYNSMQVTLNRRMAHGLTIGSQWTWGRSIGNTGGSNEANTAVNPNDFNADHGNNNFDIRHSVNATALWEVPFGKGRKYGANLHPAINGVAGGWQLGGVWNARTGLPIEVRITRPDIIYRDTRNNTYVNSPIVVNGTPVTVPVINVPGGGNFRNVRRPDVVAGVDPYLTTGDKRLVLNPAAFSVPLPGTYGNLGRNALHGPSLSQFDLTLQKRFVVHEGMAFEFRGELYNIFNRANFANPPSVLNNSLGTGANQLQPGQAYSAAAAGGAFGVINSTVERAVGLGTGRQTQLSLRFVF